jgi:rRNA-processing protein FCF1
MTKIINFIKVNISEQLPRYLEAETKLWTTQCVLDECEAFGMYSVLKGKET